MCVIVLFSILSDMFDIYPEKCKNKMSLCKGNGNLRMKSDEILVSKSITIGMFTIFTIFRLTEVVKGTIRNTKNRKKHIFVHNFLNNVQIFNLQKVLECLRFLLFFKLTWGIKGP